ncbi:hypothetical protein UFOVP313_37 [uncultured Caudovirales phage]|uniref:Uncharacterized protein n=1 Tax=uncultured Caudovirales phage TaxID=2100421 RepID=A0A6J5LQY3_9CAUD|nr:hypothetical protein UFOVP313_37 [uncultured Caudovirales phage]
MSRKQQIIDSYGGAQGISRLPRDQQQQIYYQLVDAENADALEANRQAEKQAKGSLGGDLAATGAQLGGMALGGEIMSRATGNGSLFSPGSTAGTTTGSAVGNAVGGSANIPAAGGGSSLLGNLWGSGTSSAAEPIGTAMSGGQLMGNGTTVGLASPIFPAVGAAAGAALIGKGAYDMLKGKEDKSIPGYLGRGSLAIATGGLSEVGKGLGLWGKKSTKQYQKERWGDLKKKGIANVDAAMQANHSGGDTWSDGKYKGQKWSFEKASDLAKDDPTHFQHVLGNYQVGGDQYAKMSDAQQKEFTRQMVAAGNYKSDKGDILAKDDKKAQEILQGVLSTMQNKLTPANNNQGSPGRRPEQRQEQKKKKTEESAANLSKLWGYMK